MLTALAAYTRGGYPGSTGIYYLFHVSFFALILSAFPRPRNYVYGYLAVLVTLGFWLKFTIHSLIPHPFIEPVGKFDGSGASWDAALLTSSCGAWGMIAARLIHCGLVRKYSPTVEERLRGSHAPEWYSSAGKYIWRVSLLFSIIIAAWNFRSGFFQIGMNAPASVPSIIIVAVSWSLSVGMVLWFSALLHWELQTLSCDYLVHS